MTTSALDHLTNSNLQLSTKSKLTNGYSISIRLPGKRKFIPFGYVLTLSEARQVAERLGEFRTGNNFACVSVKPLSNSTQPNGQSDD